VNYAVRHGALVITETSTPFFQFGGDMDADHPFDRLLPSQAGALTIGASGFEDTWSNISNYGTTLVDLVGPGGWADPTVPPNPVPFSPFREFIWGACSSFSQFGRLKEECAFENQPQFLVVLGAGPASAHAAGVAALIDSKYGGRFKAGQLKSTLIRTAADLESPGYDPFTGHGRIDAKAALGL
jgi:subtilisin family serine protease